MSGIQQTLLMSGTAAAGGDDNGSTDPYIANVPYLFHFEGTNTSALTTAVNSSPSVSDTFALNLGGSATHSSTQAKFGSTSAWLQASDVFTAAGSYFAWGTADYTIQFSLWIDTQQNAQLLACGGGGNLHNGMLTLINDGTLTLKQDSVVNITISGIVTGAWNDICICRVSATTRGFLGGTLASSAVTDTINWNETGGVRFSEGAFGGTKVTGFVDELRVTNGVGRFATNYTVRTSAFPDS